MIKIRHTQSLEVADYVTECGKSLADAVFIVLGSIRDGSGPRTSEVADEAMAIIASRPMPVSFQPDLFNSVAVEG